MTFELFISSRYFRSKPNQAIIALITLLSIIGVAIGVTALIVVIAVMSGFEQDLKTRIVGIEPHVVIDRSGQPLKDYADLVVTALKIPGVTDAWPVVELQAMLRAGSRVAGAQIKGIDPDAASRGLKIKILETLRETSLHEELSPLVLGRDLGQALGLLKGDTLYVISPRGALAPTGFVPYMKRFVVADFFETGMYQYDGSLVFMRLSDAQALTHMSSAASSVELRVKDILATDRIGEKFQEQLGYGFRVRDWIALNKNLFSALKLEKAAMFITLTLIILVATFSIMSSLVMLVLEKTRDIAVLRSLGATSSSIRRIFVLQGLLIGLTGTLVGVGLGLLVCYLQIHYQLVRLPGDVYYISALPVNLQYSDVALVALAAILFSFVATLYPARQAARLNPVEAIRYGR